MANTTILTAEQELQLRKPIDDYVGKIQSQINDLRVDGTDKVVSIQSDLDNLKRDRIYTAQEKAARESKLKADLEKAKAVEGKNKGQVDKLIADAEGYLKAHYDAEYYQRVVESCKQEKVVAQQKYQAAVEQLNKEHQATLAKLTDSQLGDLVQAFSNAQFSQKQESAADDFGFDFCVQNGLDPYSMASALEKLAELSQGSQSSGLQRMFSSHPDSQKRAERMRARAEELIRQQQQ